MTTATLHSRAVWTKRPSRVRTGRTQIGAVDVIAASALVLRPVVVSVAIVVAAVTWSTPAHADPIDDSITSVLSTVGIGNNGPISSAIAQIAVSLCPLLVQPGSQFASTATQASGNGGLAPPIAGFVAGQVIQSQCPAFMTALANGQLPFPLTGGSTAASPFGIPGASPLGLPAASPFGIPGASPSPTPLQIPGLYPPAPSPFSLPGV